MSRMNRKSPSRPAPKTHQGGAAARIPRITPGTMFDAVGKAVETTIDRPLEQLRRSVLACLLWEDSFYESGQSIADRIVAAAKQVDLGALAQTADEARNTYNLRSAPMLLASVLVERAAEEKMSVLKTPAGETMSVADAIVRTIGRADELAELLAIYWRGGRKAIPAQMKKGLARAFTKFDAYQLAKYDRANAIRLRDVLFLTHAKPKDDEQAALWKLLAADKLPTPDTWETELSAGKDKRVVFERLLTERKLGYLALLRNLRNMVQAGVSPELVVNALLERKGAHRVLPFRYVAAARAVPQYEPTLDQALVASLGDMPALPGKTVVLVDVSGSMGERLSRKNWKTQQVEVSDLTRMDAAATLASIIPAGKYGEPNTLRVFTFSDMLVEVAPRRGMAGIDAIRSSQSHNGTYLNRASMELGAQVEYDRLIVVTDEQSHDGGAALRKGAKGYLINVAPYEYGVNYGKDWVHLTGFSENTVRFIAEFEKPEAKIDG